MGRVAKHNWKKLFLEFNQGRYKSIAEFARAKELNPNQTRDAFKKLMPDQEKEPAKTTENNTKKQHKTTQNNCTEKTSTTQKLHPWEYLKKQFLDWPEEKLRAYLIQIEARLNELRALEDELGIDGMTKDEQKEYGQLRRERRAILSDPDPSQICKTIRCGKKCHNPVERGKEVCWMHGGAPGVGKGKGNLKHGLYSRFIPEDDEDAQAFMEDIETKSPLYILWEGIKQLSYNIARSMKIAWVRDRDDLTEHLKREKETNGLHSDGWEKEYEIQFAWDKHNRYLQTLASVEKALDNKIMRYEELLVKCEQKGLATEEQRLRIAKLKQDMDLARERMDLEKAKTEKPSDVNVQNYMDALESAAEEVWLDEDAGEDDEATGSSV